MHTEETKRKISEAMRRPLDDELLVLRTLGQTTVGEFAERRGISEQAARMRLNRLVADGDAERFRVPRQYGFAYVATMPANVTVVARKARKRSA